MDIEDLSKVQIILLVLLVSFVTSIATGIVTVSLLAQAPPAVTQTINHIIQRTVEAVAPTTGSTGGQTTTVKETTVVVKEDDLVTSSITSSFQDVGVIHDTSASSSPVVALGTLIAGGIIITDASAVTDGDHYITFPATSTVYSVKNRLSEVGIAVMSPKFGNPSGGFHIADTASVKLGQSVIALSSVTGSRVGIGSVTARYTLGHIDDDGDDVSIRAIDTSITGKTAVGAPLINVTGDVIGVATSISQGADGGVGTFVSLSDLAPLFLGVKGTTTPATVTSMP